MSTTTFRATTLFQLFFVIVSALFCGCGTNPQQSGGDGGTAIGPADAPGTLLSTVEDPEFGTYQLIAQNDDQESGKWNFLVRSARGGAKGQLRFVWDFGNGPEAEGTQQTYSFTSNGTYAITVTALQSDNSVAFVLTLTVEVVVDPNLTPIADSGADQFVTANDLVFLYGGNSADPNNDAITYQWTQTFGPVVGILHSAEASASFVAPLVNIDTDLVFRLTVSDGVAAGHDDVIVHAKPLPVPAAIGLAANAGADQQVGPGTTVALNGSATPADSTTTFVWTQLQGPSVATSGANRATASFVAPAVAATLIFELAVTQQGAIAADEVLVTVSGGGADPCAVDTDQDGLYDCVAGCPAMNCDQCPNDPRKGTPQQCGCGVPDTDTNGNGTPDCLETLDCVTSTPGWTNFSFLTQPGVFTAQFDATPNVSLMDGTIGLSQGTGTTFSNFAVLVRFNPSGTIDARNGGSYGAATTVPYAANQQFHFRLVVSVSAHTYDTYVTPQGGAEVQLGRGYAFRTEQNAVTSLNNLGVGAAIGTILQVCGLAITGPDPVANAGTDVTIVMGASTALSGSATGGTPPYTYLWSPSTGLTNVSVSNPTASPGATTAYSLLVTDSLGATASDTVTVTVQTLVALVANAGADRTIAPGGSVVLSGSATGGTPPYTYLWSPTTGLSNASIANPTATPSTTTTYTLTVKDSQLQSATDSMQTTVTLVANAGPDRTIAPGGSVALSGSARGGTPPYVYAWSPATGLSNASAALPTASPSATATYTLTVTDSLGATARDTVTVAICGDGIISAAELCEPTNLNNQTCQTMGFASGTLACNTTCTGFDTSQCVSGAGKTLYVDNDGGDGLQAGCSDAFTRDTNTITQPFCTPQRAANVVMAGDMVAIRGGTYRSPGTQGSRVLIIQEKSGSSASPIVFRNYHGESVSLVGSGTSWQVMLLEKTSYINISGLDISAGGNGVLVSNSHHINLDHLNVHNVSSRCMLISEYLAPSADYSNTHDINVSYSEFHTCGASGVYVGPRNADDEVYNVIVEDSLAYDNGFADADTQGHGFVVGGGTGTRNNTFRRVIAYGSTSTQAGLQDTRESMIEDSILFYADRNSIVDVDGNRGDGRGGKLGTVNPDNNGRHRFRGNVVFSNNTLGFGFDSVVTNNSIYNNIIYDNGWGRWGSMITGEGTYLGDSSGLSTFYNNIVYGNFRDNKGTLSASHDYNLWGDFMGTLSPNEIEGRNPLFNNPDAPVTIDFPSGTPIETKLATIRNEVKDKFSLQAGSPAIDKGVKIDGYHCSASGVDDGNGCRVWYGNAPDIGPFEYRPGGN